MKAHSSRILFILLLVMTAGWSLASAQTHILCFGDSITAGLNLDDSQTSMGGPNDGYLPHLARWLNASWSPVTLVNRGVPGDTTTLGKQRIQSVLSATSPDVVLVMLGTNDMGPIWRAGGVGLNQAVDNVATILSRIRAFGAEPILATIPPRRGSFGDPANAMTKSFNDQLRVLASRQGVRLADQEARFFDHFIREVYSDPLHPSELGYRLMAEEFAATIANVPRSSIDLAPPFAVLAEPKPFTKAAPPGGGIRLVLTDFGSGMDLTTLQLRVNGLLVQPLLAGGADNASIVYNPAQAWVFGQTVNVDVSVADRAQPANIMALNYSFTVSAGNGTAGDLDGTGRVDGADLAILAVAFGSSRGQARYRALADVDLDGIVDGTDLAFIAAQFGLML